jgi:hypothetical protein
LIALLNLCTKLLRVHFQYSFRRSSDISSAKFPSTAGLLFKPKHKLISCPSEPISIEDYETCGNRLNKAFNDVIPIGSRCVIASRPHPLRARVLSNSRHGVKYNPSRTTAELRENIQDRGFSRSQYPIQAIPVMVYKVLIQTRI